MQRELVAAQSFGNGNSALAPNDRGSSHRVGGRASNRASRGFWTAAILLALLSIIGFHLAPEVPFGIPWDEDAKVAAVLNGTQNRFYHPIYMLDLVRVANLLVGASDPQNVAWLGRLAASASGGLFVFSAMALARRAVGGIAALGAGVLTAVAPLTVLHSQLFKEDIFVAPWLIFGVLAVNHLVEKPGRRQVVLFGVTAGLAASAKYVGLILLPLSLLPPLWVATDLRRYYSMVAIAATLGLAVFCLINLPLFNVEAEGPRIFVGGLTFEVKHSLTGHDGFVLYGWQSNLLFTWLSNLWPGLRPPLALAGLGGALIIATRWKESPPVLHLTMLFGLVWYLMHELSPMKPFPEGARHMTVMAAVFAVFAAYAAEWVADRFPRHLHAIVVTTMIGALAIIPGEYSFRLVHSAPDDTQLVVKRIIASFSGQTVWARLATAEPSVEIAEPIESSHANAGIYRDQRAYCRALPTVSVAFGPISDHAPTSRRLRKTNGAAGATGKIEGGKLRFPQRALSDRCSGGKSQCT